MLANEAAVVAEVDPPLIASLFESRGFVNGWWIASFPARQATVARIDLIHKLPAARKLQPERAAGR